MIVPHFAQYEVMITPSSQEVAPGIRVPIILSSWSVTVYSMVFAMMVLPFLAITMVSTTFISHPSAGV